MTKDEILSIIERESGRTVQESTQLEALGADSLEMLSIFSALEIPDAAIPDLHTVGDILRYLGAH